MLQKPMNCMPPRHAGSRTLALALFLSMGLAATPVAVAAGPTAPLLRAADPDFSMQAIAVSDETVSLMAGLIGIERDLLLGQLFLQDGLVSAEGSHFTHPRHENFPVIKDGLAKVGAPDLEPLLIALEEATDKEAVDKAYIGVLTGIKVAKEKLAPTEHDTLAAVIETAEASLSMLDSSGTTEVLAYQEAWGLMMVARGQLDVLLFSRDPVVKTAATKMALAFDDVVLTAPDPGAKAPVAFDPAVVAAMIATLRGQLESI
jgi:hypothetical protein